ncbi:MAG: YdiU family protein [Cyanobacteria bacterium]|nr:YdiU family protein [Cyanobacteria bacterium CG_2015-16_32_12]NCO77107.1 YdiU family protein [Cyanobacteria bacterium CG_2015-22_32_23]NCQ03950.1 YdiU family protein [Cyanobacteria bacterium CG_2015-09_32_10]NCQ42442.1 YdiU family protein [Cyanobacteria bacterium CG_2015-04_32_10]NCS85980.1 YdiU family protein [Cyanobacteria bacterium CG_2015-02_32_10]
MTNPFLNLEYETAIENLGDSYYEEVSAAEFPQQILRFANDDLLPVIGLDKNAVKENDWIEAFGKFQGIRPFLALKYHGYQFGSYNPQLGDGRGFLYGQIRGNNGILYDFGTKGSGRTPYSRTADGRLTLKGGIREVIAGEALHRQGVNTSRCFSLIETGESLWRGDEPSPTRSSVMVRFSQSHIRFGTFERLHYLQRPDLVKNLLDHVIYYYYPHLTTSENPYIEFYRELVQRVALLAAQWMAAGFCHGVLNTDNMSITGESFDYGPYAFINTYDPLFTAAYFDYGGRYSYGNQPLICQWNLELLQKPLSLVIPYQDLQEALTNYNQHYEQFYQSLMVKKLGFNKLPDNLAKKLVTETINLLKESQVSYSQFFADLASQFNYGWHENNSLILENSDINSSNFDIWKKLYHQALENFVREELDNIKITLNQYNPQIVPIRNIIEEIWQPITTEDNWQPFYDLLAKIRS